MNDQSAGADLIDLAADIVSAYVSNNTVPVGDLPALIADVHRALSNTQTGRNDPDPEPLKPAVNPKKSVFPDYIICLEDGQRLEMLKRHLRAAHAMTPGEYRTRWGLPRDYPMVAPKYAARRSALAKEIGLRRKPGLPEERDAPRIQRIAEGVRGRGAARTATGT